MSAELVHTYEWDTPDTQLFLGLGLGRDEVFLYEYRYGNAGTRVYDFDVGDVVRCLDYSRAHKSVVGFGLGSGTVHVREMSDASTGLAFKQRVSRKCNTLSFSSAGLVAAGFEKARGSDSVMLWDLAAGDTVAEPMMSVFTNEFISSIAFVPSQPTTLLCGGAKLIREVDTRTASAVNAVATNFAMGLTFNHLDDRIFAAYGEAGTLALWDRRMLTGATNSARDPSLSIPSVFKHSLKSEPRCVRFSPSSINEVSVLHEGSVIRRWQTSRIPDTSHRKTQTSHLSMELHGGANGETEGKKQIEDESVLDALFVDKVFDVKTEVDKVVSFDYAPHSRTGAPEVVCIRQSGSVFRMPITEPPVDLHFDSFNGFDMLVACNEIVELDAAVSLQGRVSSVLPTGEWLVNRTTSSPMLVQSPQVARKSSVDDPDTALGRTLTGTTSASEREGDDDGSDDDGSDDEEDEANADNPDSEEENARLGSDDTSRFGEDELSVSRVLYNDITSVIRRRALAGYGLDPVHNIDIIKKSSMNQPSSASSGLLAAWRWIHLHQSSKDKEYLQTTNVDLTYLGVQSAWDGLSEEALKQRLSADVKMSHKVIDDAVRRAISRAPNSVYVSVQGEDDVYRQMCLRLSGWDFGLQELETKLEKLESQGQFEKAAGWAVFHNNVERAVESLAKSRKRNLRLMSSAVAGYLVYKDVPTNNVWREQSRRLSSEMSVPYLRAIFAYIADGSWLDVLDDGSLPLTERLGIALRFLPQKEVGAYLTRLTTRAIANGDLEGIILTGFTPKILDLLQSYLDRTSDIQTVCLIVSFGWPRFLDDERIPQWISEYRRLLNSWRYFSQRARFDVGRNKLSLAGLQQPAKPAVPHQVFLKCSNCKNLIGRSSAQEATRGTRSKGAKHGSAKWTWNRCPTCNFPLPPCGVCGLPLGPHIGAEAESERWPVFCLRCNHGSHSLHARQWFEKYEICPVPTCKCLCGRSLRRHSGA